MALWTRMASLFKSLSPAKSDIERLMTSLCHFNWCCFTELLFSSTPLAKASGERSLGKLVQTNLGSTARFILASS